jgi:hypothetical protein
MADFKLRKEFCIGHFKIFDRRFFFLRLGLFLQHYCFRTSEAVHILTVYSKIYPFFCSHASVLGSVTN